MLGRVGCCLRLSLNLLPFRQALRTQRNCSRWNDVDAFVQIARTLNLSREQRATLFSSRAYLHEKFDK